MAGTAARAGFLGLPEGIEVLWHWHAGLDFQRIKGCRGQRGSFAAGDAELEKARRLPCAGEGQFAAMEGDFLRRLWMQAIFAEDAGEFGRL